MGIMMVVSFVAGILLALRFKVFVLVPATFLAGVVIVSSSHQPKQTIALTVAGTAVLLQMVIALLQRRSMGPSSDSFSKSTGSFSTWRAAVRGVEKTSND